jgi:hypothetical protein
MSAMNDVNHLNAITHSIINLYFANVMKFRRLKELANFYSNLLKPIINGSS